MSKIVVAGSLNMDLRFAMKRMPLEGETVLADSLLYNPGGKGANQAAAAAKLGGSVAMLGCVGKDGFGDALAKSLEDCGCDVSRLARVDDPTGTAAIYVDERGRNSIVVVSGANGRCDTAYLKGCEDVLKACDILLLQLEIPYEAVWHLAKKAHALGKTVILNPAPAPEEGGIPKDVLACVDWITPNETELSRLSGLPCEDPEQIEEAASKLRALGAANVLVTVGSQGAFLCTPEMAELIPTEKVKAVDTTAAGDCFNGAFAVGLSEGMTPAEAVAFANRAASISVTRPGAQSSLPSRGEL
ncbi:MAG: ribokinase [Clostridia bacterium]|nr:ribokinase [Clostridia bacterium]